MIIDDGDLHLVDALSRDAQRLALVVRQRCLQGLLDATHVAEFERRHGELVLVARLDGVQRLVVLLVELTVKNGRAVKCLRRRVTAAEQQHHRFGEEHLKIFK